MPELPEVETTRRGLAPHLADARVTAVTVRERRLRWPVTDGIEAAVTGRRIESVSRRGKYLLLTLDDTSHLLWHLGMSGSLRVVPPETPVQRHDHVDVTLDDSRVLRFNDPRRFGSLHHVLGAPEAHPLLARLGPEPLGPDFHGDRLHARARGRRAPVKAFIMDSATVVGVGNIYATEALYLAGIHPARAAGRISRNRYRRLATAIATVLGEAITAGGTTLRDFTDADGRPGYFRQRLRAYGHGGAPCGRCGHPLREITVAQRTTTYCPTCQR
ncbi:bifunctional DNA-formamidopyrimidine glycosylase/DNA-(apurinic or apyrimidinic site) lyase [Arhodomonas aquaeolei]|uniref:bifunctional DNA-formamidopyrimidine glycosylase/DNA-(apurinic or apyrimidinic site) lyase n=1 Tax=Arhodomonas aquaeolei TaxID=2369 RepID=UPI000369E434|nr:bifunctional DNA-formamidopyrimidine glycosylase/DNA-(apurinic or apyrimidinic site) lyase [Arhodomonas aquaeolei]